jgi:hypothetical protein
MIVTERDGHSAAREERLDPASVIAAAGPIWSNDRRVMPATRSRDARDLVMLSLPKTAMELVGSKWINGGNTFRHWTAFKIPVLSATEFRAYRSIFRLRRLFPTTCDLR